MAYRLYLTVRPTPAEGDIPALLSSLEKAFPRKENRDYLASLRGKENHPAPARTVAQRLGALSLLPVLLAAANIPTEGLCLRRDSHGRPFCERADGPVDFDFNLSHSAAHVAGALLVGGGTVGVDVEELLPPARALPLLRRWCTEGELAIAAPLSEDEEALARYFTSTWVEREALSKQEGGGMPLRFDTARIPEGVTLWSGYLCDSDTALALSAPLSNAPPSPRILDSSLPVRFS